jgi:hypothetical protein
MTNYVNILMPALGRSKQSQYRNSLQALKHALIGDQSMPAL